MAALNILISLISIEYKKPKLLARISKKEKSSIYNKIILKTFFFNLIIQEKKYARAVIEYELNFPLHNHFSVDKLQQHKDFILNIFCFYYNISRIFYIVNLENLSSDYLKLAQIFYEDYCSSLSKKCLKDDFSKYCNRIVSIVNYQLGLKYYKEIKYQNSYIYFQKYLEYSRKVIDVEPRIDLDAKFYYGNILLYFNQLTEAIYYFGNAVNLADAIFGNTSEEFIHYYSALGMSIMTIGRFKDALEIFKEIIVLTKNFKNKKEKIDNFNKYQSIIKDLKDRIQEEELEKITNKNN